jgi:hypothetical protein
MLIMLMQAIQKIIINNTRLRLHVFSQLIQNNPLVR